MSNDFETKAKSTGEAFERRFYTNNNNLNLNENKLLLVRTAVDLRHQLSAFPSYLKNNVKEMLKLKLNSISVSRLIKVVILLISTEEPKP